MSALGVTEEVVQGLVAALSAIVGSVVSQVTAVADIVVDGAVRRGLLGSVVSVVAWVLGVAILRLTGMHLGTMIIVTSCGSCKVLQVSNDYFDCQSGLGYNQYCCATYLCRLVCSPSFAHRVVLGTAGGPSRRRAS